jgi:hypothetical protein
MQSPDQVPSFVTALVRFTLSLAVSVTIMVAAAGT